jgi:uncharacterized protein YciI
MSLADRAPEGRGQVVYRLIFLNGILGRPLSPEVVNLHAARLTRLDDEGKLVLAGPIPERAGGLIVLRVASLAEAKAIAEDDPMIRGGVQTYELGSWFISDRQNNFQPDLRGGTKK